MSFTKRTLVKIIASTIVPWSSMYKTDLKTKESLVFEITAREKEIRKDFFSFFYNLQKIKSLKSMKRLSLPSKKAQLLKEKRLSRLSRKLQNSFLFLKEHIACHVNSFTDVFWLFSRKLAFLQYLELSQPSVSGFWTFPLSVIISVNKSWVCACLAGN